MPDTSDILDALHGIASRLNADMSEKDVENAFLNENFYALLGYGGAGFDLRSEWSLPDNRRPDYVTLNENETVTAVYEFKTTGESLGSHEDQLFHYVDELKADYGVLTNGEEIRLYRRDGRSRLLTTRLEDATEGDAADLEAALRKPEWDITDPESVNDFLDRLDEVELNSELGRDHFFDTFRLEEDSPFANLVTAMMDLLEELRDEQHAKFVEGAYDFWEVSYASEPDETPDSWESFIGGKQSLRDFMFCLESGHAILARLLLAKATDDHDFFPTEKGLRRYFDELGGFSGTIDLDAYPIAANGMIEDMRNQLVQSLFEDDIFIWWADGYGEQTASQHKNPYNRFETVAKEGSEVTRVTPATRERFSRAIAQVSFAVLKFDFSRIKGDPLGDLYQRYFDPETRKALGEFYTPQPVVNYIMDGVDYDVGISQDRIIDPSCGSGTFLVEAVNRYIKDVRRYNDDPDWSKHLSELCTHPHIVGLDIHPFAVLMAQIRFMVAILPEYREAKRGQEDFTIRRLPIFRTDSLRNERELTGIDLGDEGQTQTTLGSITEDNQDVKIPVPLPIEVDESEVPETEIEEGFLIQRVRMPKYDTAKINAGVRNFGEYYAALQGVLDVVKYHMSEGWWEYGGGLDEGIHRYTSREYDSVESFFEPYVNDILATVRYLKEDHGDGRLFKMFEDTVLALVVKNYMEYEYVVGNPPYVNIKNISDEKLDMYRDYYQSAYGRFDLYVLFIERGLNMLSENGKLGYITSNKFAKSKYGKNIRKIISDNFGLEQYIDFGDTGVFEDAVNYPCILIVGRNKRASTHYAKIRRPIEDPLKRVRSLIGKEEFVSDDLEVSSYPQAEIGESTWMFTPEKVRNVGSQLQARAETTLDEVSMGVREGVAPGGDDAFIVTPEFAKEKDLEDNILQPIIRGGNVRRWRVKWKKEFAIYPYNDRGELVNIEDYPNIKAHLDNHRAYLEDRYCVKKQNKSVYEYHGPHSKSVFEGNFRIATPDMSTENNFSYTSEFDCFKNTVYVITFPQDVNYSEMELLGILNSSVAEFIVKQNSPYVNSKYFRYKTQYINPIPIPENTDGIEEKVERILQLENKRQKTEEFPESYLNEFDGSLEYIEYEWQTNRRPVEAEISELNDGRKAITAGRTDEITSAIIDTGSEAEKELRAKFVRDAVNGDKVKSGEVQQIPIPKKQSAISHIYNQMKSDLTELEESSISRLEREINKLIYEGFSLSDKEQSVIKEYISVFK